MKDKERIMQISFSRNMDGDTLVLVNGRVVALAKECEGYREEFFDVQKISNPLPLNDEIDRCPECGFR